MPSVEGTLRILATRMANLVRGVVHFALHLLDKCFIYPPPLFNSLVTTQLTKGLGVSCVTVVIANRRRRSILNASKATWLCCKCRRKVI